MVASVNTKTGQVKLVSIARDTYVAIPGYNNTRINHAFSYGGPELAIRTLNENFGLDVTDYVAVNFDSLAEVIDAMGGVEVDVTEAERQQINAYLLSGEPLYETGCRRSAIPVSARLIMMICVPLVRERFLRPSLKRRRRLTLWNTPPMCGNSPLWCRPPSAMMSF